MKPQEMAAMMVSDADEWEESLRQHSPWAECMCKPGRAVRHIQRGPEAVRAYRFRGYRKPLHPRPRAELVNCRRDDRVK